MTTSLAVMQSAVAYPLAAYGRIEGDWADVLGLPDVQDATFALPGAPDYIFAPQTPRGRVFTVRIVIARATEALVNDSLIQLRGLLWSPTAPVLFRRTIPVAASNEVSEAYAAYLTGFRPSRPAPNVALLAPEFRMMTPHWTDTTSSLAVSL